MRGRCSTQNSELSQAVEQKPAPLRDAKHGAERAAGPGHQLVRPCNSLNRQRSWLEGGGAAITSQPLAARSAGRVSGDACRVAPLPVAHTQRSRGPDGPSVEGHSRMATTTREPQLSGGLASAKARCSRKRRAEPQRLPTLRGRGSERLFPPLGMRAVPGNNPTSPWGLARAQTEPLQLRSPGSSSTPAS